MRKIVEDTIIVGAGAALGIWASGGPLSSPLAWLYMGVMCTACGFLAWLSGRYK